MELLNVKFTKMSLRKKLRELIEYWEGVGSEYRANGDLDTQEIIEQMASDFRKTIGTTPTYLEKLYKCEEKWAKAVLEYAEHGDSFRLALAKQGLEEIQSLIKEYRDEKL
jgi:hypothetical protein